MPLNPTELKGLAEALAHTHPDEIDCDEWLDQVVEYLELAERGGPIPPRLRAVENHLGLCPECREEYEAMRRALGEE